MNQKPSGFMGFDFQVGSGQRIDVERCRVALSSDTALPQVLLCRRVILVLQGREADRAVEDGAHVWLCSLVKSASLMPSGFVMVCSACNPCSSVLLGLGHVLLRHLRTALRRPRRGGCKPGKANARRLLGFDLQHASSRHRASSARRPPADRPPSATPARLPSSRCWDRSGERPPGACAFCAGFCCWMALT